MMFNDLTLARRLEAAKLASADDYVDAKRRLAPDLGVMAQRVGEGFAVFAGLGSPVNRVHGLGMNNPVKEGEIEAFEDFYATRGEATRIDLCPLAHDSLRQLLTARGYGIQLFKHIWRRPLSNADPVSQPTPRLRVEVLTPATALLWAQVVGAAFSGHSSLNEADTSISLTNVYKKQTTCFLAWIDDDPAGGGAVAMHDGVAILYSTSVRPAVRRMGVHSALLHARLKYASNAGCDLFTVSTTPGSASQRNVERCGFRLAYTKPTMVRQ